MADETPVDELEGRDLDIAIAVEVLGYKKRVLEPDWYDLPVTCFFDPHGIIEYSYDDRACNAMMYRNGEDESEGFADPLPSYSWEDADARRLLWHFDTWHVERVNDPGGPGSGDFYYEAHCTSYRPEGYGTATADTAPLAICRAALKSVRSQP